MSRRRAHRGGGDNEKPPIIDVIEKYFDRAVPHPGHGHVKISCVFHEDNNPSMSVNVDTQYAKCFSCQWSGDSFSLIMEVEGTDFNGAVRAAEENFGYSSPQGSRQPSQQPAARRISILDRNKGNDGNNSPNVPPRASARRRPRLR